MAASGNTHKMREQKIRSLRISLCTALFAACPVPGSVEAADYPSRPLRLIVPFGAGSGADIAARHLGNELGRQVAQQIVVDNRPGGSAIIGYELLSRSAPDGYTFGYIGFPFVTNPSLYSKLPYDTARDFQPVILSTAGINMLVVSGSLPVRSVKELIDAARMKPGKLSFGSTGMGSGAHLSMELFKSMTGTNMLPVSYKSIQQAITDVISGEIHAVCDTLSSVLPHAKAGRVRALAVTSLKRSAIFPDLPTVDEAGVPGFEVTNWGGYSFPARTLPVHVQWLNAEMNRALASPSVLKGIAERGAAPVGGPPEQFANHLKQEIAKWASVIKAAGIKPQ